MVLAYYYNRVTQEYFIETLVNKNYKKHKGVVRIGLAISLSVPEFRYRVKRKSKKTNIIFLNYRHQYIVWRSDLNKWTVSEIPF